jgi:hypothetical protein
MVMENINLATLIIGVLCGIGLIEVILWVRAVIKHRGDDCFRFDLLQASTTQARIAEGSERSHSPDTRK